MLVPSRYFDPVTLRGKESLILLLKLDLKQNEIKKLTFNLITF